MSTPFDSRAAEPAQQAAEIGHEQPVGELLRQLSQDTSILVRQEIALAKAEMLAKAKPAARGGGMLAAAAVLGLALLGAVTTALIAAIAIAIPVWAAALAVMGLYALLIGVLALGGRAALRKAKPAQPEQTIETVKEDVEWAKTQAKSARK